jgi:hypothetical protein
MVMVDDTQKTKTAKNLITARFYSIRYGLVATQAYRSLKIAKRLAARALRHHSDFDRYEILNIEGQVVVEGIYGFDVRYAMRDLRRYRNCCRTEIAGWEMNSEGFRLLVAKGYIVPGVNHLGHEAGYWFITKRFRQIGRYLVKRGWGLEV